MGTAVLSTIVGCPTCKATIWDPHHPAITMACSNACREMSEKSVGHRAAECDHDNFRRRALQVSCSDVRSFFFELTTEADHGIVRCRLIGTGSRDPGRRRLSRQLATLDVALN